MHPANLRPALRRFLAPLLVVTSSALPTAQQPSREQLEVGVGAVAKLVASGVFVSGRTVEGVLDAEFAPEDPLSAVLRPLLSIELDRVAAKVEVAALGVRRVAVYREGLGCSLVPSAELASRTQHEALSPAERADDPRPWPTGDRDAVWPAEPEDLNRVALDAALDAVFAGYAPPADPRTRAVIVVYDGKIVAERYGAGFDRQTRLHGWSMTKAVVDALVALRVGSGELAVDRPTGLQAWSEEEDRRSHILLEDLLRMRSGLRWRERYDDLLADPARMLFGQADAAAFAAARDLEAEPGKLWRYSSGTTNLICRVLRESFGSDREYLAFPRRELFDRIGMRGAVLETDPSGTFLGSSMLYASARDWVRFGLLYLDGGRWEGEQLLPEGWVAASVTPTEQAARGRYGRHWWLNAGDVEDPSQRVYPSLPRDLFYASGYEGQLLAMVPSRRALVLRLGCTKARGAFADRQFLRSVLGALPGGGVERPASRATGK